MRLCFKVLHRFVSQFHAVNWPSPSVVCLEEVVWQFKRVVMPRGSELRVVFAGPHEMCVGEGLVTLVAEHRLCYMFSFATVDVCSPGYLI